MKVLSDMSAERTYSNYFRPALLVVLILGAVFALASTLAFSSVSARADDGRFAGGTGTANDPYQIATAAQLENLAIGSTMGNRQTKITMCSLPILI